MRPASRPATLVLRAFALLGLTELTTHPTTGAVLEATNLTILNFFLLRLGPLSEKRLVQVLMATQVRRRALRAFFYSGLLGRPALNGSLVCARSRGACSRSLCGTDWRDWCMMEIVDERCV